MSLEELEETARSYDQITSYRMYIVWVWDTALAGELYRPDSRFNLWHRADAGLRAVRKRSEAY